MNWLLIVAGVIVISSMIVGFFRGFVKSIFSLFSFFIVLVAACFLAPKVDQYVEKNTKIYQMVEYHQREKQKLYGDNPQEWEVAKYLRRLNKQQVKLPQIILSAEKPMNDQTHEPNALNPSSLIHYLGIRAIGQNTVQEDPYARRTFNAVPFLGYYDIFKNYYANKQEENFYTIGVGDVTEVQNPANAQSPIRVMAKFLVGENKNWELVTESFMNLYYAENKIIQYIIEIADTVFPSDGDINQLILTGEYLSDATNVTGTFEITAKQMAGNAALSYNNQAGVS